MQHLRNGKFDTLIIGGGIFGAGCAREAALLGWKTALIEANDFGSATSGASSKLLHGGLRYLSSGRVRLVREALQERELLQQLAPSLARPTPFMVPLQKSGGLAPWKLRCGLFLYDVLSGAPKERRREWLNANLAAKRERALSTENLNGAGLYWDTCTDDARLVMSAILAAEAAHATVANYTAVTRIKPDGVGFVVHFTDSHDGTAGQLRARTIINAAGPWSDSIRRMLLPDARPRALYSKGVHIVVEERSSQNALFLSAGNDGRIFFIIPYHGRSLVGTTDSAHHGPPAEIRVEGSDIDYLVRASRTALARPIDPSEIISSFAGVRTLINGQGTLSDISREELIWEEPHGVIHVLGGKLTTFRRIAQRMIKMAAQRNKCPTDDGKLSTTTPFPEDGLSMSAVDQPLNLKATDYEHAVNHLHVKTARDLARRRLPIVLVRKLTPSERLEIAQGLGNFLDWSPGEVNRQAESLAQNHE